MCLKPLDIVHPILDNIAISKSLVSQYNKFHILCGQSDINLHSLWLLAIQSRLKNYIYNNQVPFDKLLHANLIHLL